MASGVVAPNPYAPPLAQPPRRVPTAIRCAAAVFLGWITFVGTQMVFLEIWNHTVHRPVYQYLKARHDVWLLNLMMDTALPVAGSLLGSLASMKVDKRPWWRAPTLLATVISAIGVVSLARNGTFAIPLAWLGLFVSVVSTLGGAFLFSRTLGWRRRA
jgi:hypothetical protein